MSDLSLVQILNPGPQPPSSLHSSVALVASRYRRFARLVEMDAPEIVLGNEKRMLAEALESLSAEADIEDIVLSLGWETFAQYFSYIMAEDTSSDRDILSAPLLPI